MSNKSTKRDSKMTVYKSQELTLPKIDERHINNQNSNDLSKLEQKSLDARIGNI